MHSKCIFSIESAKSLISFALYLVVTSCAAKGFFFLQLGKPEWRETRRIYTRKIRKTVLTWLAEWWKRKFQQNLNTSEGPNYLTACAPPSNLPQRHFCTVCGFPSNYTCVSCGARYCCVKCLGTHHETRCLKWTV
ncbi:zinc finger HIT domain-containing protein 1 isoform X2 [Pituophis catenifer annectens]|uniref:zinc finger HIT domain-containing protein 1 isoform X2 n=1 Tax=Pituophis catenifer annectens TaxID=94852 RepID=UPI003994F64D